MEQIIFRRIQFIMIVALVAWVIISCRHDYITKGGDSGTASSCEACHTDYTLLKEVYTPDTAAPPGGCGGTAPHYEPYDRVYMGGDNYEAFKATSHYPLGCTYCHNGNDQSDDKATAHSGDFIRHPSMYAADKCGGCHPNIVADAATSLHHGTGQKRKKHW